MGTTSRRGNVYAKQTEAGPEKLPGVIERLPRALRVHAAGGDPQLRLLFPKRGTVEEQSLNASFLLRYPGLTDALAQSLLGGLSARSTATRHEVLADLGRGFIAFLDATLQAGECEDFAVRDIKPGMVNGFIGWLDQVNPATGQAAWSPGTRAARLSAFATVLGGLRRGPLAADVHPLLQIRRSPWPGRHREVKATAIIQHEDFARMYRACVAEVLEGRRQYEEGRRLIEENLFRIPTAARGRSAYADRGVCLAAADQLFPGIVPPAGEIAKVNPALSAAIELRGTTEFRRCFHPTARDLVPIILLLTACFDYNPSTILTSEVDDFERFTVLGTERIRGLPNKARSNRRQRRTHAVTDDPDNPAVLLDWLSVWTSRLRRVAAPETASRNFLFIHAKGGEGALSFASRQEANGDARWSAGLASFCRKHGLPSFTLKQIRHTVHDQAHDLFDGDLRMIAAIGGQRSAQVINDHYTSASAVDRNWERLAGPQALLHRDRRTSNRTEAARARAEGGDLGAATPGWSCLDAYSSPMPGEVEGRLCQAYGRCPVCPHSQLDTSSALACARTYDLLARVDESAATLASETYLARWAPVRDRLVNHWLPLFPAPVIEDARNVRVARMPPLE